MKNYEVSSELDSENFKSTMDSETQLEAGYLACEALSKGSNIDKLLSRSEDMASYTTYMIIVMSAATNLCSEHEEMAVEWLSGLKAN